MIVLCCGMSRSGSTVQYQLVKEMIERSALGFGHGISTRLTADACLDSQDLHVFKAEEFMAWEGNLIDDGAAIGVGIYRDPRDVMVSLDRFYRERAEFAMLNDYTGFESVFDTHMNNAVRWQMTWEAHGIPFLRYEDYWPTMVGMAGDCSLALGLNVCETIINIAKNEYRRARNLERMRALERWYDGTTSLTKTHIGPQGGRPGAWRETLSQDQARLVETTFEQWMRQHGYELSG